MACDVLSLEAYQRPLRTLDEMKRSLRATPLVCALVTGCLSLEPAGVNGGAGAARSVADPIDAPARPPEVEEPADEPQYDPALAEAREDAARARIALVESERGLAEAEAAAAEAAQALADAERELAESERSASEADGRIATLQRELEDARQRLAAAEQELASAQAALAASPGEPGKSPRRGSACAPGSAVTLRGRQYRCNGRGAAYDSAATWWAAMP